MILIGQAMGKPRTPPFARVERLIVYYLQGKVGWSTKFGNSVGENHGCLPFTPANRSVYHLGRFGQMTSKFPYWENSVRTGASHLQKSLPFTKKFARRRRLTRRSQNKSFDQQNNDSPRALFLVYFFAVLCTTTT